MPSQSAYLVVGLSAVVAALVGVLAFAVLRFGAAARDMRLRTRAADGERAFVSAALEDAIRKLRGQEQAMAARAQSSEHLSAQIVSNLTSGLIVVGLDRSVSMVNPAALRLLRLPEAPEGSDVRKLLAGAPALAQVVEECLEAAEPAIRRSISVSRADGGDMHLGVTVSLLPGDRGIPLGAICLFSDLTAVVELEEQLRLKDSLSRLGELTAGLAHEFRNGLATVHGYARLIDPAQLPGQYGPYLQAIRDETDALGRVVTNFLNFARPVQLTLTPVDLDAIVASAVQEFRPEVEARGGSIAATGGSAVVEGDEVLLRQAVTNLLRNAIEAATSDSAAPRVVVESRVDPVQGLVRLTVSDNGPGVDPSLRERIFKPFFTTRPRGTGLGLALVQKIIVTHNGRIAVGASDSGGAAFTVILPLSGRR